MTDTYDIGAALRMAQWERAKGELNALLQMQGAYHSPQPDHPESKYQRFLLFKDALSAFCAELEGEGWNE